MAHTSNGARHSGGPSKPGQRHNCTRLSSQCDGHGDGKSIVVDATGYSLTTRQWACPEGAPLKKSNTDLVLNDLSGYSGHQTVPSQFAASRTFIADFDKSVDFCYNPDMMNFVSQTPRKRTVFADLLSITFSCRAPL